MIVQGYNHFHDMPQDMRYLESSTESGGFIEHGMIFIVPARLRKYRRSLFHVRLNDGPAAEYAPIFRCRCQTSSEPLPEGYDGPYDVYPFYARTSRTRGHRKDYYVLFLFRDKMSYVRFRDLAGG